MDLFCALPHVLFSPQGRLTAMTDDALARVGKARTVSMTLPWFSGVCRTVSRSEALAMVPRQYAERVAPNMGLELYRPPMPIGVPLIVAAWHRRSSANPAHRWMRDLLAAILGTLDAGRPDAPA
jgi:DNA-binding transcriptional LysR family regulator